MEIKQLEKLRDFICAELSAETMTATQQDLISALVLIPIRDGLLRYLYDNSETRPNVARNLEAVLTNCVNHEVAAIGTIIAGCYWLNSDFEQTRNFLDQALEADPTYSLARLLDVALNHGVPAKVWADSLAAVTPEQCLSGAA